MKAKDVKKGLWVGVRSNGKRGGMSMAVIAHGKPTWRFDHRDDLQDNGSGVLVDLVVDDRTVSRRVASLGQILGPWSEVRDQPWLGSKSRTKAR